MFLTGTSIWDKITGSSNSASNLVDMTITAERSIIGHILNVIRVAGTGIALIMLTYMAIRYFTADGRGSPMAAEKRAEIKGTQLKNFAIGVIIFIGASNILYFIEQFVEQIFTDMF
jgi:hypothetical protein